MELLIYRRYFGRRVVHRNRIFRDRSHPFEKYNDYEIFKKYRFRRHHILAITDSVGQQIELVNRLGSLPPLLQVMIALRFYASGSFQDVCGELIGVDQSTVCRTIPRVTEALVLQLPQIVKLPTQEAAERTKIKVFTTYGFPNVFGCIDGTQIRIQAPGEFEHEFVNRKHYHSLNVQVICDADLMFINSIVKWPGSVHDARILRESYLFEVFEGAAKPVTGLLLGDSGYMLRDWLFTPFLQPHTRQEMAYNTVHKRARSMVERAIGLLKRRWHCLRRLRLEPVKACSVINACLVLHNKARLLNVDVPSDSDSDNDEDPEGEEAEEPYDQRPHNYQQSERVRSQVGKAARRRMVENYF